MRRYLNLQSILILLFFHTLTASAQEINQVNEAGKKVGVWEKKSPDESLIYRGTFKDGQPVGQFQRFHANGAVKADMFFVEGTPISTVQFYRENATLISQGQYYGKEKDRVWLYFNETGEFPLSVETYNKGVPHGDWIIIYEENGRFSLKGTWVDGFLEGEVVGYFFNGGTKLIRHYHQSKLNGEVKMFYSDGVLKGIGNYKNDLKIGRWIFYNKQGEESIVEIYDEQGEMVEKIDHKNQDPAMFKDATGKSEAEIFPDFVDPRNNDVSL